MKRLGSELPLYVDRIGPAQSWQPNWLAFSNGRAALAWFLDKLPAIKTVAICAYTCPSVPRFLRARGLNVQICDIGVEWPWTDLAIVPALFGCPPDLDNCQGTITVIDAAQTAFGHIDFEPPFGDSAVLSCPRKCTELADGAVLSVSKLSFDMRKEVESLPVAQDAASFKISARAAWTIGDCDMALSDNKAAEEKWPVTPYRMSNPSRAMLERLDRNWHRLARQHNADCLAAYLASLKRKIWTWKIPAPVPFSFPIFVGNPDEVVAKLKEDSIFVTRLWPDSEHDPALHPNAAWMAKHLVSLPIDQRHDAKDMVRVADAVLAIAKLPPEPPEGLRRFVG